jgi:hypothetical protein
MQPEKSALPTSFTEACVAMFRMDAGLAPSHVILTALPVREGEKL